MIMRLHTIIILQAIKVIIELRQFGQYLKIVL